jgi:hypothetical protein
MAEMGMNRELTVACNNSLQANIAAMTKIITRSRNHVFVTAVAVAGRKDWMMVLLCWRFLVQIPPPVCYLPFLYIRMCIHTLSFCHQQKRRAAHVDIQTKCVTNREFLDVVCTSTHTGNNLIDTGNLSRHTCLPIY